MAGRLQLRRGTSTQHSTFTGVLGEVTYNTTTNTIHIHDGTTEGGSPLLKLSEATPDATETVAGKAKIATTVIAQTGTNDTDIITAKKLRDALNASGNAPISACRAWVCFNGITGAIKESFNISSLVKNATGDYTLNFSASMPHANYFYAGGVTSSSVNTNSLFFGAYGAYQSPPVLKTTTQFRIICANTVRIDVEDMTLGVFC